MKVPSPQEIVSLYELTNAVNSKFAQLLKKEDPTEKNFFLVIRGEHPRNILDEVETLYEHAGWKDVKCKTSTELGGISGFTLLTLSIP